MTDRRRRVAMGAIRATLPVITGVHRTVYRRTRGRVGHRIPGAPFRFLVLEHRGRRTGEPRETPLLYLADDVGFVVVGSNAGQDRPPAWWLNLQAEPDAAVRLGRTRVEVRARRAEGEELDRLWERLEDTLWVFSEYRAVDAREVPVVVLERRDGGAP